MDDFDRTQGIDVESDSRLAYELSNSRVAIGVRDLRRD
jgi:hypothetical protein